MFQFVRLEEVKSWGFQEVDFKIYFQAFLNARLIQEPI